MVLEQRELDNKSELTTPIPSNAYIAVPKYKGICCQVENAFTVFVGGKS